MKRKNIYNTNENRKRVVDAYNAGRSASQIAEFMNMKRTTVHMIIKKYKETGEVNCSKCGGNKATILNLQQRNAIMEWINEDCSITLKSMADKCLSEFGIKVSLPTLHNYIKGFKYSLKRIHVLPERRNDDKAIQARKKYAAEFLELLGTFSESQVIFIDEVGFNVCMRSTRGRSYVGTPATLTAPGIRSRNISVCCAMNCERIIFYKSQIMSFNSNNFVTFIDDLSVTLHEDSINTAIFIMDNVPFHKSEVVKEAITRNGWRFLYLPPYSPFLNPIENMFSKWKQSVRRNSPANENDLRNMINNGSNLITTQDCSGYYRNMFRYIRRSINCEEIYN